jgi:putative MATE family efflux protein
MIVAAAAVAGLLTIDPLFRALGADEQTLPFISEYMSVWYVGMIFVVFPMVGNNCIRATGDTKTPGRVMVIGAATNAILDPLLIFGLGPFPELGIRGAAMATLIGRGITFFVAVYVLGFREKLIDVRPGHFRHVWQSWKAVLYVGIPTAATRMIVPIGAGIVTRIVSQYGPETVAGYGVATRLEFFALAIVNALAAVMGPFIGQNLGARLPGRVMDGYRTGERISLIVGAFFLVLFAALAGIIASVFSKSPEVTRVAASYIRIVSLAYGLQGIYLISVPALNVMRRPLHAAGLGIIEMFVLVVPLALLGSAVARTTGVFAGIAIAYAITGLVSSWLFRRVHARLA